jgi:hypothetical protein
MNSKRFLLRTALIVTKHADAKAVYKKYRENKNRNNSAVERLECCYTTLNNALNANLLEEKESQSISNVKAAIKYFV